jgi:importin subunit alpha-6/7
LSEDDNGIVLYACDAVVSILELGQDHIEAVIQHQIIPPLVEILAWDNEFISASVVKAFRAVVSNGTPNQIRVLVSSGCIGPLCGLLNGDFRDTVVEVLKVLGNILRAGADRSEITIAAEVVEEGGLALLRVFRRQDIPELQAIASAIHQTIFGDEEESGSASESDASEEPDGDDNGEEESETGSESGADEVEDQNDAEPPLQRPRIA